MFVTVTLKRLSSGWHRRLIALLACLALSIPTMLSAASPDDVAVVIGNRNYRNPHVPAVEYALRDADAFDYYLVDVLGYRDGNIIDLRDASQAEMEAVLGNTRTIQGRLWQLVKTGRSEIIVYYSGHGAPGQQDHKGYLLPADADPEKPEINGFPIELLTENLSKLGAKTTTVFIDACFSGDTPKGALMRSASGIFIAPKEPTVPTGMVVMTAGHADQVASWDSHHHHGLFTEVLLDGLYGKADQAPYGNGDGKITVRKLKAYLDDVMTYAARREFGRTQNVSVYGEENRVLVSLPEGKMIARPELPEPQRAVTLAPAVQPAAPPPAPALSKTVSEPQAGSENDRLFWASIKDSSKIIDYEAYIRRFPNGTFVDLARSHIDNLKHAQTAATPSPQAPTTYETFAPAPKAAAPSSARVSTQVYFNTEQAAQQTCPGVTVVWVNTDTLVYHYPGRRWYGRTKDGAYMCESSRGQVGARPAMNGQ